MKNIPKFLFVLTVGLLYSATCCAVEKNPPVGSFPSKGLNVSFLFKQDDNAFFPDSINYKNKNSIKISSFPSGKIVVFVKVEQDLSQKEGAVMYKLVRVYNREVMRERKGKVLLWTGKKFYKNTGIVTENWEETVYNAHTFGLMQINDYASGIRIDGIDKALDLSWDRSRGHLLSDRQITKLLELNFSNDVNNSLFTIGFIHFSEFKGVRWLPIDVFIAEDEGCLNDVHLDVYVIKGSEKTLLGKYWIEAE